MLSIDGFLKKIDAEIPDPRRTSHGHVLHKLSDIIIISLVSIICGCDSFRKIEVFSKEREKFFSTFLDLPNGIPDADTIRRCFEKIDPQLLSMCLYDYIDDIAKAQSLDVRHIAIDGKTIKGSKSKEHKPYHILTCFCTDYQVVFGEICLAEKTNEITGFYDIIKIVDIKNSIITGDAMFCQREIVKTIIKEKSDFVFCVKDNQLTLNSDIKLYMENCNHPYDIEKTEKGHGRIETRKYRLIPDTSCITNKKDWKSVKSIGEVRKTTIIWDKITEEVRYYITSLTDVEEFAKSNRGHWKIENNLHWELDLTFREDSNRAKKDNSPKNLNIIRKLGLNLLKRAKENALDKRATKPEIMIRCAATSYNVKCLLLGKPF